MEQKKQEKERETAEESIDVVLTIDIGTINTRVSLFERENGRYHFTGTASSRMPGKARSDGARSRRRRRSGKSA